METRSRKLNWNTLKDNLTLNFIVLLDFLLIGGLIVGKTKFLYSSLSSFCLILSMAILFTILYSRTDNMPSNANELEKKWIIASVGLKVFILFQLPKFVVDVANVWILLLPLVIAVASLSFYYFWKSFEKELSPLFSFLNVAGRELSKATKSQISSITRNFKEKTAYLPTASSVLRKKGRQAVN